jgi:hypothetical protein
MVSMLLTSLNLNAKRYCLINSTFLPPMRLNRNTPRAVVHGPLRYGGLGLADTRTRQTQLHVKDLIMYLRWDQTVGGDYSQRWTISN